MEPRAPPSSDEPDDHAYTQLAQFIEKDCRKLYKDWGRSICSKCGVSRAFFCFDCLEILVPRQDWPKAIQDAQNRLQLPFRLDVILDDRRASATGVQIASLLQHACDQCRLIEAADIPLYDEAEGSTYILFPATDSVPLSRVVSLLDRLVVLDCKWTKSSVRLHPSFTNLPKVHLDGPPRPSLFWRWHNAGPGMLSTAEAIYYAAYALSDSRRRRDLVNLLWLFGLQRETIRRSHHYQDKSLDGMRELPFTEQGKAQQRSLRERLPATFAPDAR